MDETNSLSELPERGWSDHFRDALLLGAGFIPLIPVSDTLERYLPSSIANRQRKWQLRVADKIQALEDQMEILPQTLFENDVFLTALIEATWIAIRHHQEEQLEYLCNMVINSALPDSPEDSMQKTFFRLVNAFTPWHIKILEFFSHPDWHQTSGFNNKFYSDATPDELQKRIVRLFPGLKDEVNFAYLILNDLAVNMLLLAEQGTSDDERDMKVTQLGHTFLKFIKSPLNQANK